MTTTAYEYAIISVAITITANTRSIRVRALRLSSLARIVPRTFVGFCFSNHLKNFWAATRIGPETAAQQRKIANWGETVPPTLKRLSCL